MTRVAVRGIEIDCELRGNGPPTVVWSHGLTSNREHEDHGTLLDWNRVGAACRTLRYDARGHGLSDTSADAASFSWESLAHDQLALADSFGIDRYLAGGASMGCGTALHAAVLAPERITALLLAVPPTAWETRQAMAALRSQTADFVESHGIDALIQASAALPVADPLAGRADIAAENERNLRATDLARLATIFRGAAHADLPARDAVAQIAVPTLILAWSGDSGHPVSTAEQLRDLIPGAELVVASTWDQLSRWTDLATDFIAAQSS